MTNQYDSPVKQAMELFDRGLTSFPVKETPTLVSNPAPQATSKNDKPATADDRTTNETSDSEEESGSEEEESGTVEEEETEIGDE